MILGLVFGEISVLFQLGRINYKYQKLNRVVNLINSILINKKASGLK